MNSIKLEQMEQIAFKATLHIPVEQYGFIEAEINGNPEEIVWAYREIKSAWNKKEEDKKIKVANTMRTKEIADPLNHIDVTLETNE